MKFHKQTIFTGSGRPGNCVQAALASILDLELDEVPHFLETASSPEEWELAFQAWLHERRIFIARYSSEWIFPCLYLASGTTKRNPNVWHMVVMQDGKLIHDPHPENTGLVQVKQIRLLVPYDPSKILR